MTSAGKENSLFFRIIWANNVRKRFSVALKIEDCENKVVAMQD